MKILGNLIWLLFGGFAIFLEYIVITSYSIHYTKLYDEEITLKYNWRSDKNIIDFNNEIIARLIDVFESRLFSTIPENERYLNKFRNIYASFQQKPGKKEADSKA